MTDRISLHTWGIIAAVVVVTIVWASIVGLTCAWQEFMWPLLVLVALAAGALYYRQREERFTLCLTALMQIMLFSSAFIVLTYLGAALGVPLADRRLATWDAALGCHLPSIMAWCAQHPHIDRLLTLAYYSMFLQTACVIAILGLLGDREPLKLFIRRMVLAALVTFAFYVLLPAEGPFNAYGYPPAPHVARYVSDIRALRSGAFDCFHLRAAQGLVTFPSFHAIWALLMVIAVAHRPVFCWPLAALNAAVLVATVTHGGHYVCDVVGGLFITILVCWLTHREARQVVSAATPE